MIGKIFVCSVVYLGVGCQVILSFPGPFIILVQLYDPFFDMVSQRCRFEPRCRKRDTQTVCTVNVSVYMLSYIACLNLWFVGWRFLLTCNYVSEYRNFFPTVKPLTTLFNLPLELIFCPPQLKRDPSAKPLNYLSENAVGKTLSLMVKRIMLVTSEWLTGAFVVCEGCK